MRSIMTTNGAMPASHQTKTPQVFTDEELSEIFQINFAEIFGSPAEKPKSDYKGINLPKKDNLGQKNIIFSALKYIKPNLVNILENIACVCTYC